MKIIKMRTNHLTNPIGYELSKLSLSWIAESSGVEQKESRVLISDDADFGRIISDSGWSVLDNLNYRPMGADGKTLELEPFTRYYWRVSVRADNGDEGISETAFFETAKMGEPWTGRWITSPFAEHPVFRGRFEAEAGHKGRICLCGVGLYEVYCNGTKVTDEVLLPGYHSYDLQLMYQTFVLDEWLRDGMNEITVMLGPGWYMGRFGFGGGASHIYGEQMALICEVYVDGGLVRYSDESWECKPSPVLSSNIYDGEVWDARLESEDEWQKAVYLEPSAASGMTDRLVERINPPLTVVETIKPAALIETPGGEKILDFGQNLAGWFTFVCREENGTEICIDCAEHMQHGEFYRDNLRTAKAALNYVSNGTKTVVRPHFTYFGFRYLRVKGIKEIEKADVQALVLSSVRERTGIWETSDQLVNRLMENARWGQLGNFIELPTDCPQRDERMGWTGDAQIFAPTACYQYDSAAFYAKYMKDVWLEQQLEKGSVPFVVPSLKVNLMPGARQSSGSCAWSDVATILPWTVYLFYGDRSLLETEYDSMKAWVDFIRTQETPDHLWMSGFHFADWLALEKTDPFYCASGYYCYSAALVSKAAHVLGYEEDAKFYGELADAVRASVRKVYFNPDGSCRIDTQTACVLALMFDLCEEMHRDQLARRLHQMLTEQKSQLKTALSARVMCVKCCRRPASSGTR